MARADLHSPNRNHKLNDNDVNQEHHLTVFCFFLLNIKTLSEHALKSWLASGAGR